MHQVHNLRFPSNIVASNLRAITFNDPGCVVSRPFPFRVEYKPDYVDYLALTDRIANYMLQVHVRNLVQVRLAKHLTLFLPQY